MQKPIISTETNFSQIQCQQAFKVLNIKQKMYAYNFSKACWNGSIICFFQRSYQSPALLYLLLKIFHSSLSEQIWQYAIKFIDKDQLIKIYIYISAFFDNNGNYKSFGDSKFIPQCSKQIFKQFFTKSKYWQNRLQQLNKIYNRIQQYIFNYDCPYGLINFKDKNGTTSYYSCNITSEQAEKIKNILIHKGLLCENNRLIKLENGTYKIKIASQLKLNEQKFNSDGLDFIIQYGQFSSFLTKVNYYLSQAKKYTANEIQQKMIQKYILHFRTGSMQQHKQSQKLWIQDKQPIIETNIGFIQSYLDPMKIRAQFEGFVTIVNQNQSKLLTNLVELAPKCLSYLPWGPNFEVQSFKKPDFTSLEVLTFASSGIPIGINIPNYHDIRQTLGFKNVNLGNAYGQPTIKSIQYCSMNEVELHLKYYQPSLFVIVALHELLGHGSGRLLNAQPKFTNPLNNQAIKTYYKENQTWHSVFGEIASTYEECRADSVALYLSVYEDIQAILLPNFTQEQRWDIVYVSWFDLIVGGLRGLQYFDAVGNKWLQPHIGASFAILSVLRQAGGIFEIQQTQRDGKQYLQIHLNRESIKTKGKQAIGKFLQHLQIYKSTANMKEGSTYFNKYLQVDGKLMSYREIVLKNKKPRRLTIQPNLEIVDGIPKYFNFPSNSFGCIDSSIYHYKESIEDVIKQWQNNNQSFRY